MGMGTMDAGIPGFTGCVPDRISTQIRLISGILAVLAISARQCCINSAVSAWLGFRFWQHTLTPACHIPAFCRAPRHVIHKPQNFSVCDFRLPRPAHGFSSPLAHQSRVWGICRGDATEFGRENYRGWFIFRVGCKFCVSALVHLSQ